LHQLVSCDNFLCEEALSRSHLFDLADSVRCLIAMAVCSDVLDTLWCAQTSCAAASSHFGIIRVGGRQNVRHKSTRASRGTISCSVHDRNTLEVVEKAELGIDRVYDRASNCRDSGVSSSRTVATAGRRSLLAGCAIVPLALESSVICHTASASTSPSLDLAVTDKAYLDFSLCPTAIRLDRTLGNMAMICDDGEPLGRIVIGLYGNHVPHTVDNFKAMVTGAAGSSYKGTCIHKILQGQYVMAGKQGNGERGEVVPPTKLSSNPDTVKGSSFELSHKRAGLVSLCLAENDDEESIKDDSYYRNVEFLITTGPGPAFQLDNGNIIFGTVLEGMDVVSRIAAVPTFKPGDRIKAFNELAQFIGDDRASKGRSTWDRPLKAIVISDCGLLA